MSFLLSALSKMHLHLEVTEKTPSLCVKIDPIDFFSLESIMSN